MTHVVHNYQVNASWNLHPDDVFKSDVFCLGDASTRATWMSYITNYKKREAAYLAGRGGEFEYPREFFTEYVLKTGALWAGPIKDFELIIRKSVATELISTCFSGLIKTSPVEFRVHRANYLPSEDLRVLYLPPAPSNEKRP